MSFSVFATFILDDIAYAFARYFGLPWKRVEVSHAQLIKHFQTSYQAKALVMPDKPVVALMHDLQARIVEQFPTIQDIEFYDLPHMMTLIDEYILAMLEVFERNIAHSVFSQTRRSKQTS